MPLTNGFCRGERYASPTYFKRTVNNLAFDRQNYVLMIDNVYDPPCYNYLNYDDLVTLSPTVNVLGSKALDIYFGTGLKPGTSYWGMINKGFFTNGTKDPRSTFPTVAFYGQQTITKNSLTDNPRIQFTKTIAAGTKKLSDHEIFVSATPMTSVSYIPNWPMHTEAGLGTNSYQSGNTWYLNFTTLSFDLSQTFYFVAVAKKDLPAPTTAVK